MEKNEFVPFFLNLNNKKILEVGGGKIAHRKVKTLLNCGGNISLIAEKIIIDEINSLNISILMEKLSLDNNILQCQLEKLELNRYFMVIAATDCKELNSSITKICDEKNILVNNITSQDEMNLRFCKHFQGENFQIGVSGKGDPNIAKELEKKLISFISKGN